MLPQLFYLCDFPTRLTLRLKAPFLDFIGTGSIGRFQGFLAAFWQAAFMIVGPEYVAVIAGEAKHPRKNLTRAFRSVNIRFFLFFVGGALCVGIVVAANDPTLVAILTGTKSGSGTGAASPYIIAMTNMGIAVLPDLVNALLFTSIFSAGNAAVYRSTRSLHGLASSSQAPAFLRKTTSRGVPIYCFLVVMIFPFLSLLQLSNTTAKVLDW